VKPNHTRAKEEQGSEGPKKEGAQCVPITMETTVLALMWWSPFSKGWQRPSVVMVTDCYQMHKIFIASNGSLSSFLSPVVPVSVNVYLGRIFLLRKALIYFSLLKTLSNILGLAFLLKEIFDFVDLCWRIWRLSLLPQSKVCISFSLSLLFDHRSRFVWFWLRVIFDLDDDH